MDKSGGDPTDEPDLIDQVLERASGAATSAMRPWAAAFLVAIACVVALLAMIAALLAAILFRYGSTLG